MAKACGLGRVGALDTRCLRAYWLLQLMGARGHR